MSALPGSKAQVVVITGLAGAGRSEAARSLEDIGWFVIDNLPPALISTMLKLALAPGNDIHRIALVIDARGKSFFNDASTAIDQLEGEVSRFTLVFLEADDEAIVRRFDATRRRHPMSENERVTDGIQRERELLRNFRERADIVLDTSDLSVHELRSKMRSYFETSSAHDELVITLVSFGYKHGLPLDADMVLDVRFLPNPHWVDALRPLSGNDAPVRDYVLSQPGAEEFVDRSRDLLSILLPGYQKEGRHYFTLAIGCTGGRHRSVALSHELAERMREKGFNVNIVHRDVDRVGQR
jgi:RNase adapter protein RapZ